MWVYECVGAIDAFDAVGVVPAREEITLKTDRAGRLIFFIGAKGGDGGGFGVEVGPRGGSDDASFKSHAGMPAVAPEHHEHAREGKNQRGGRGVGATGNNAPSDENKPDRGQQQHE